MITHNVNNLYFGGYIADKYQVWSCIKQRVRKMVHPTEHLNMYLTSIDFCTMSYLDKMA
jgi:hypothetical protein